MFGLSLAESANSGSRMHSTTGIAAFDSDDEYCHSVSAEDSVATMDTQTLSDNTAVECPDGDGTALLTASFVSFDANGWTLNYSAVDSNAKYFWALAIEEESAAGLSIPVAMHHYMHKVFG